MPNNWLSPSSRWPFTGEFFSNLHISFIDLHMLSGGQVYCSTNYNHTFCQWWLLAVIKNCSQVFIVLAQLLKYLQIDCNILPWHGSPLCYWPFVRGIHWSSMDYPHKRLAAQALIFSLMLAWTNCWTNIPVPGYFTRYDTHVKVFANLLQSLSFTGLW